MSALHHIRGLRAFALLLLFLSSVLRAETPQTPQMPETPTMSGTASPPPAAQQSDRRGGQGAAAAAAAAAAAMQGMTCIMMMREAQRKGDQMMMMMAMQQCAQAAQSAMNAAQNKEGEKKLSDQQNNPQGQEIKAKPLQVPETPKDEKPMEAAQPASTTEEESGSEEFEMPEYKLPETASNDFRSKGTGDASFSGGKTTPVGVSVPERIDRAKLGYDETGKSSQSATPTRELAFGTTLAGTRMSPLADSAAARTALEGFIPLDKAAKRGARATQEALEGLNGDTRPAPGAAAFGGEKTEDNNPLDAMLAILGGGPKGEEGRYGGGSDILVPPEKNVNKPGINIFQYASLRYSQITDEGALRARIPGRAALANPGFYAKVSHEGTPPKDAPPAVPQETLPVETADE